MDMNDGMWVALISEERQKVFACMNISRRVVLDQTLEAIIDIMHPPKFQRG